MSGPTAGLEQIFQRQIQTLALTLRPSTVHGYRGTVRRFLAYLRATDPHLQQLIDLRRDPHLLGWFGSLREQPRPLCQKSCWSHILLLRRLLEDLAANGHAMAPHLIRPQDFPQLPHYLPRALSPADDQRLQQALRRADDLPANALLLVRLTGMRIGECLDLALGCLRQIGPDSWGLHVPLGKLHTERMVPADAAIRQTVARLLTLRGEPSADAASSSGLLLPRQGARRTVYRMLCSTLADAAQRVGCSAPVTPHQLRHTFASEMVRLGVSLPAVMQLLGHKDIRMTLRYVQITQVDLQREFHTARRHAPAQHQVPLRSLPHTATAVSLTGICQALVATRHLMEMYRRQLEDEKTSRQLRRLDHRLLAVATEVEMLATAEK